VRVREALAVLVACGLGLLLGGCGGEIGGPTPVRRSPRSNSYDGGRGASGAGAPGRAVSVTALEQDYHGWPALHLSNGIVSLVAVPAVGGRVMEYNLGGAKLLWVNEQEYGQLYPPPRSKEERKWHNFGGYKVWPAPEREWGGPPDPLGSELDGGQWTGEIVPPSGDAAAIRLVSGPDASVTGLEITREVALPRDTTEVRVKETFTNVTQRTITWSIWDVTQVAGLVDANGEPTGKAQVFVPLNPGSRAQGGYWMSAKQTETEQYRTIDEGRLLEVTYRRQSGKVFADSAAGWVAYVNDEAGLTYVKRFKVEAGAEYPDDGATVEVYTSGGLPYMEVEVLSPLTELKPGASFSFSESWYATKLNAPVLEVSEFAAIRKRPTLEVTDAGLRVTGELGVFAPGQIRITAADEGGAEVGQAATLAVSPSQTVVLDQSIEQIEGATTVRIEMLDKAGQALGTIATLAIPGNEDAAEAEAGGCPCRMAANDG